VVLVDGVLAAYLARGEREMWTFLPAEEPARSRVAKALAGALARWALRSGRSLIGWDSADDMPLARSPLAPFLVEAGFAPSGGGFRLGV
jgi:ATP-dependent Lhr-like helicase